MSASNPPDETALASFWNGRVFELLERTAADSAIGRLLESFDLAFWNGGAFFLSFQYCGEPGSAGDWFVSRNLYLECRFFEHLVTSPAFLGLFDPGAMPDHQDPMGWQTESPYALAGNWAFSLKAGGAYSRFHRSGAEAMRSAEAARQELFGDRYEDQWVFSCRKAWNDWFFGQHWDKTWAGYDTRTRRVWILAETDTD